MRRYRLFLLSFLFVAGLALLLLLPAVLAQRPDLGKDRDIHLIGGGSVAATTTPSPTPTSTLNDSLVAFWKLDEESGTRYDCIGSNHLTDVNTVGQIEGKIGYAARFIEPNDEYLSIDDNAILSMGDIDFTIAFWVRITNVGTSRYLVTKRAASEGYATFYQNSSNRLRFVVVDDGVNADSLGAPSIDTWYFVVVWHDATADKIYIQVNNGAVDSADHTGGCPDESNPFLLGTVSTYYHWGDLDAVGVWKGRCLTADERTELWNDGDGKEPPF